MGQMKTEYEVYQEGYDSVTNMTKNNYLVNTWAYRAFERGREQALEDAKASKRTTDREQT